MIFHKMIEICLKDDNMHEFVMINALMCINNHVITCINSMLSSLSTDDGQSSRHTRIGRALLSRIATIKYDLICHC